MVWDPWDKNDPSGLVRYLPQGVVDRFGIAIRKKELLDGGGPVEIARAVYEALLSRVPNPVNYDDPPAGSVGDRQTIRTPDQILDGRRQGTCLDLALLYCGLCLDYELIPLLIVMEGHVIAAISLTHTLRGHWRQNVPRPMGPLERNTRMLDTRVDNADNQAKAQKFREMVVDTGAYAVIECTGFACMRRQDERYPEFTRRNADGFLPFDEARRAGEQQLSGAVPGRRLLFALDLEHRRYTPLWQYPPRLAGQPPVIERPVESPQSLSSDQRREICQSLREQLQQFNYKQQSRLHLQFARSERCAGAFLIHGLSDSGQYWLLSRFRRWYARQQRTIVLEPTVSLGSLMRSWTIEELWQDLGARISSQVGPHGRPRVETAAEIVSHLADVLLGGSVLVKIRQVEQLAENAAQMQMLVEQFWGPLLQAGKAAPADSRLLLFMIAERDCTDLWPALFASPQPGDVDGQLDLPMPWDASSPLKLPALQSQFAGAELQAWLNDNDEILPSPVIRYSVTNLLQDTANGIPDRVAECLYYRTCRCDDRWWRPS